MSENIKVTPVQLARQLQTLLQANIPALISGAPGQGKSQIAIQAAKEYGADIRMMHGVSMLPTDTRGLGTIAIDRSHAVWLPYGDMLAMIEATSPTVILIDDIGQAPQSVQASLMQLLEARRINDWKISDHVRYILTTNRREDKAGVQSVIEPLKNRCIVLELENTIDAWVQWALDANIPAPIISFYQFRPELLNKFTPSSDVTNSPTARQAANCGKIYQLADPQDRLALFAGAIGKPAAIEMIAYIQMINDLPNIQAIIIDPMGAPVSSNPAICYATIAGLVAKTTTGNYQAIMQYIARLSLEYQALYIRLVTRDVPGVKQTREYIQWTSANQWLYN
jgi:hypothetical protein